MKCVFIVNVDIDEGVVQLDSKRYQRSPERVLAELLADVECRLHDAIRYRDGVSRVGLELLVDPTEVRQ